MITLGIDPGTATTGYGVVEIIGNKLKMIEHGCITTPAHTALELRLQELFRKLKGLILQHKPEALAVEEIFFNKNVKTAVSVAQARGVIMLSAAEHSLKVGEYTPPQIKLAVTGYGKADKRQVQSMVQTLLNLDKIPKPDDAADGLAVAICHLHSSRY